MPKELVVVQQKKGCFMGGPYTCNITYSENDITYHVSILQSCTRSITISTETIVELTQLRSIYYSLITYLLLFDGYFCSVATVTEDDVKITNDFIRNEPACYQSADFMLIYKDVTLHYSDYLSSESLSRWVNLKEILDISFTAVLYSLSSVQMPIDMKCAYLIEAFKPLAELTKKEVPDFVLQNESTLKQCLLAIINRYGQDIFSKEIETDRDSFLTVLVSSRNRMAHIKSGQNEKVLNGEECSIYLRKLSRLYRVTIFNLLGISQSVYQSNMQKQVDLINAEKNLETFLSRLAKAKV